MHYHAVYLWLENNNLWKATVGWAVGGLLGLSWAWLPWSKHRRAQEEILKELRKNNEGIRDRRDS